MAFGAFGERVEPGDPSMVSLSTAALNAITTRGFTGHEHVDELGIIHMNGRIYDAQLGRFLQADPYVQAPKNGQNLNRYSYVLNNPLSYTDPSGYFFDSLFKNFGRFLGRWGRTLIGVGFAIGTFGGSVALLGAAAAGGLAGAVGGYVATGTLDGAVFGAQLGLSLGLGLGGEGVGRLIGAFRGGWDRLASLRDGRAGHEFATAGTGVWSSLHSSNSSNSSSSIAARAFAGLMNTSSYVDAAFRMTLKMFVPSRQPTTQEVTYARLARGVYNRGYLGDDGYQRVRQFEREDNGLLAALFVHKGTGHSVLAFAGTNSVADIPENFNQGVGKGSEQYYSAIRIALREDLAASGNIHFVGHSLGGGIATAAAFYTQGSATVFNAAAVDPFTTLGRDPGSRGHVTHFYSVFDVLRIGNALVPGRVPGQGVSLGNAGFHQMNQICEAMGC